MFRCLDWPDPFIVRYYAFCLNQLIEIICLFDVLVLQYFAHFLVFFSRRMALVFLPDETKTLGVVRFLGLTNRVRKCLAEVSLTTEFSLWNDTCLESGLRLLHPAWVWDARLESGRPAPPRCSSDISLNKNLILVRLLIFRFSFIKLGRRLFSKLSARLVPFLGSRLIKIFLFDVTNNHSLHLGIGIPVFREEA